MYFSNQEQLEKSKNKTLYFKKTKGNESGLITGFPTSCTRSSRNSE